MFIFHQHLSTTRKFSIDDIKAFSIEELVEALIQQVEHKSSLNININSFINCSSVNDFTVNKAYAETLNDQVHF